MLSEDVQTLVELARYHAPWEDLPSALPVVLATGVIGLAMCLGGARAVRTLITAVFGVFGAILGAWLSVRTPFPAWLTVTIGTLALGYTGNVGYRVWVGVGSAVMLTTVVMIIYGGNTVVPQFNAFSNPTRANVFKNMEFRVPGVKEARLRHTEPSEYFDQFWQYFKEQEPKWRLHLSLMTVSAAVAGLVFGMLAPKFSSALWTSAVGIVFLTTSVVTATAEMNPEAEANYLAHPDYVGWTMLIGLSGATYLQWLTIKKPKKKKGGAAAGGAGGGGGGGGGGA